MKLDLSLTNTQLYAGCEIETVAGRANLKTPVAVAVDLVGRNIAEMVQTYRHACDEEGNHTAGYSADMSEVTLTGGPMAVWAYLIVFHAVVHCFGRVYYDDGRSGPVLIAAHGS